jgi:hypothetical protein
MTKQNTSYLNFCLKVKEMFKDRGFIERKMKHYNEWMFDKNRDPNSKYPGFPEEIAFEFIQKEYVKEFLSRPKKGKVKNEERIEQKA